jgi:hypothetical protein
MLKSSVFVRGESVWSGLDAKPVPACPSGVPPIITRSANAIAAKQICDFRSAESFSAQRRGVLDVVAFSQGGINTRGEKTTSISRGFVMRTSRNQFAKRVL